MRKVRPWTCVVSEYLDLTVLLRGAGELVISLRSPEEALAFFDQCSPRRIVIDTGFKGAKQVIAYARNQCPESRVELHYQVISRMLAS